MIVTSVSLLLLWRNARHQKLLHQQRVREEKEAHLNAQNHLYNMYVGTNVFVHQQLQQHELQTYRSTPHELIAHLRKHAAGDRNSSADRLRNGSDGSVLYHWYLELLLLQDQIIVAQGEEPPNAVQTKGTTQVEEEETDLSRLLGGICQESQTCFNISYCNGQGLKLPKSTAVAGSAVDLSIVHTETISTDHLESICFQTRCCGHVMQICVSCNSAPKHQSNEYELTTDLHVPGIREAGLEILRSGSHSHPERLIKEVLWPALRTF